MILAGVPNQKNYVQFMNKPDVVTNRSIQWILIVNGIINVVIGLRQFFISDSWGTWGSLLGALLLLTGSISLVYGLKLGGTGKNFTSK